MATPTELTEEKESLLSHLSAHEPGPYEAGAIGALRGAGDLLSKAGWDVVSDWLFRYAENPECPPPAPVKEEA